MSGSTAFTSFMERLDKYIDPTLYEGLRRNVRIGCAVMSMECPNMSGWTWKQLKDAWTALEEQLTITKTRLAEQRASLLALHQLAAEVEYHRELGITDVLTVTTKPNSKKRAVSPKLKPQFVPDYVAPSLQVAETLFSQMEEELPSEALELLQETLEKEVRPTKPFDIVVTAQEIDVVFHKFNILDCVFRPHTINEPKFYSKEHKSVQRCLFQWFSQPTNQTLNRRLFGGYRSD